MTSNSVWHPQKTINILNFSHECRNLRNRGHAFPHFMNLYIIAPFLGYKVAHFAHWDASRMHMPPIL